MHEITHCPPCVSIKLLAPEHSRVNQIQQNNKRSTYNPLEIESYFAERDLKKVTITRRKTHINDGPHAAIDHAYSHGSQYMKSFSKEERERCHPIPPGANK